MGIIVGGQELDAPEGLVVKNFNDPSVFHFKNQSRPMKNVTEVVVHETVDRSWPATVDILKQRGLGVHFIVDADGTVYQHADLLLEEMWHASQHNGPSVGIETVNPYQPSFMPSGGPWTQVIDASWAAGGKYVVPTAAEAEAVCQLLNWLTSAAANPLTIPQKWPGLTQQGDAYLLAMGRVAALTNPPKPGVLAHTYWQHADGAWLVLYSWLRLEACLSPDVAYQEAVSRATGTVAAVDLSDYFADNPYLMTG